MARSLWPRRQPEPGFLPRTPWETSAYRTLTAHYPAWHSLASRSLAGPALCVPVPHLLNGDDSNVT